MSLSFGLLIISTNSVNSLLYNAVLHTCGLVSQGPQGPDGRKDTERKK